MTKRDIDLVDNSDWIKGRNKTGTLYSRDPDVDPPATLIERFWYGLYKIVKWIESEECIFAVKTAGGFVLLSLPAYLPQSAGWFFNWKGQWATITLMMWAIPLTGQFYFTVVLRVIATVIGGVMGIVIWEIVRGNPYGLTILTFVVMLPVYHIFFTREVLRMGTIMVQITLVLVTCYEYQGVASGTATDSVESVAGKRILLVVIGVAAAAVLAWLPKSITGRVALRKRISQTLHDMSKLYGLLVGDILHTMTDSEPTTNQLKAFRKLAYDIRRQIADERTYLKLTRLEPPLRGKFPYKIYATLVEKIDNMSDLLQGMGFSTRHTDKAWKRSIVKVIHEERMQYIAFVLTTLKLLSTALVSKISLPPYMIRPRQMRRKLNERLSSVIRECPEHMDSDSFPSYCAFAVCSFKFAEELEEVIDCVEKLVGVEDPEKWLLINA
ncbi:hypothetical protein BDF20DRAFT_812473 [Mycotypha africana]|uniref:uncharacterized protein n=1 Tax=Mycotypha africana TaxID=64632 RepID=UPI002300B717|nr:uncharacterized protein BDF20DRAFT_812473 [Mycotypha africana]KAI8991729.1 hypothetical protein BDF20DRAFT_812473 [Mycotypha africana]